MKKDMSLDELGDELDAEPGNALKDELLDEFRKLAERGLLSADDCASLARGERVAVNLCGIAALMDMDWLRYGGECPILELDKPLTGVLCPAKGTASVAVGFACHNGEVFQLLGLAWRHAVPGRKPVQFVLEAYGEGDGDIFFSSLGDALSAGAKMLHQATGGLVTDALAECNPPALLAAFPPDELADPNDDFVGVNEEVLP